jgi:anaerobic ribonucleoside-triphosphate reductase activating protein
MADPVLDLGAWMARSCVNGPGDRFVLWTQGCTRGCPGCFSPQFQPCEERHRIAVSRVAEAVLSVPGLEGVTYTGGEPMRQARALSALSRIVRARGLTVVCYTGFTLAELRAGGDPDVADLLAMVDLLIDGPYVEAERAPLPWRGSRNQCVHVLTDRYRDLGSGNEEPGRRVELSFGRDGFVTTGVWPDRVLAAAWERVRSGRVVDPDSRNEVG